MKFNIKNLTLINTHYSETENYRIDRKLYYNTLEEALKDAIRIYNDMINLLKKNKKSKDKYQDIVFIIGISKTDGKTAIKVKEKTKGRPKYTVYGTEKRPHIHIAVFGYKASSFCNEILKILNKHNNKELFKELRKRYNNSNNNLFLFEKEKLKGQDNGIDYIPYIYNQSQKILTNQQNSDFNFKDTYDGLYICNIDETFS